MASEDDQWYFYPATGKVSQGKTGPWDGRMGPYATEEEARNALETARRRNDEFDQQEDDWRDL